MLMIAIIVAVMIALAIVIVLILAATKPDSFSIERRATINAPPEKVFPLISDFHQWRGWSPWETRTPT